MSCDLYGIGVLVTRPSGQAGPLCDLITAQGGKAIHFPTIAIESAEDLSGARACLQQMDDYNVVIFVSPNAVRYAFELMEGVRFFPETKVAAVGTGTARALAGRGVEVDILPEEHFDSESLLALSELTEVAGKRVLIVRGNGGRTLLADTLRARGAEVEYAEVYSRNIASADAGSLLASWRTEVQIVVATSCEIVENLFLILGESGSAMLCQTPLVVVSERIKTRAQELGCNSIILAGEASDQGLLKSICDWAQGGGEKPAPAREQ